MGSARPEVLQGVRVFDVTVEHDTVAIDLFGGPAHACGTVRFFVPNPVERSDFVLTVWRWRREQAPLTLVRLDGSARLVDEEATLAALDTHPASLA